MDFMTVWYNSKGYCWKLIIFVCDFRSICIWSIGTVWIQKIADIKLMTFTCFYWLFNVEKFSNNSYKRANFMDFLCAIFWAQTVPIPSSFILLTLCNIVNFEVNLVSTLIWRSPTLPRHINLTATLKRCWNVCWVIYKLFKVLWKLDINFYQILIA